MAAPGRLHSPAALDMRLFRGAFVDERVVVEETRRLQRFFEPYGLGFETAAVATSTSVAYAMSGTQPELEAALDAAGIPSDGTLDEDERVRARRAIGAVIFADLRDFVRQHSEPGANLVNLVVLERIVEPELAIELYGVEDAPVIGYGLSPALLAQLRDGAPGSTLHETVGLDEEFTPTLFVGHDAAAGLEEPAADNLVAHEMGHALGLVHSSDLDNVMSEFINPMCVGGLSGEQIAQVARALEGSGP